VPTRRFILRYLTFLIGILFMGLGIALTAKSTLGTSPISSVPWVLAMIFPLSFGQWTFLFNLTFVGLQILLLGKKFPPLQYLQFLVTAFFGFFIDLGMKLFASVHPATYADKLLILAIGTLLLAIGVYVQVSAHALYNSGEGLVRAFSIHFKLRFGTMKILFDTTLVACASILSFATFHQVRGIREGTLVSALSVGLIANFLARQLHRIRITSRYLHWLAEDEELNPES